MPDTDTVEAVRHLRNFLESRKSASGSLQSSATNTTAAPAPAAMDFASQASAIANQLAPLASQASAAIGNVMQNAGPRAVTMEGNLSWFDRNQRKDEQGREIPIDMDRGINLGDFSRMVWQRRPEERIAVLRKMFPNQIVRVADTGEPIVEILEPGGNRKDVLVNPPGFNAQDMLEAVQGGAAPTTAGIVGLGIGTAVGGKIGGPFGARAGGIVGAAIGTGIGGAAQDIIARKAEGQPLQLEEIATEQAKQATLNGLFDVGLLGGAKALRAFSPFGPGKGPLQFNLEKGKKYFKTVHGIDFQVTPGERTGSEILQRLEAVEAQLPGSSKVLVDLYKKGEGQIARIFDAAIGKVTPKESLGTDLITQLQTTAIKPAEDAVAMAREALIKKGESELVGLIDATTGRVGSTTKQQAGEAVRSKFQSAQTLAKSRVDAAYNTVRGLPGGSRKVLSGDPVANAANAIMAEIPKVTTSTGTEPLKSAIPEGLLRSLTDMQAQRGQKMSLDELTALKNAAYDEIKKTEAVPDVKDRWFNQVASAYANAIDSGVSANPRLKAALTIAKTTYQDALLPLDRVGLHDILQTPFESGYKAPEQLVNRLFSGERAEHNYRMLKEALGASSPAFDQIKRATLDNWVLNATDKLTQRIKPEVFEASMDALRSSHPEIYKEVIGSAEQPMAQAIRSIKAAGMEAKDIDPQELMALLRHGSPTKGEVLNLVQAQKLRDTALTNTYLKKIGSGQGLGNITPSEFVSSLSNAEIKSDQLQEVLSKLTPGQLEDLRTAKLYEIASKAAGSQIDLARYQSGKANPVSAQGLAKAMGQAGSDERVRNELLLGPKWQELVENTINVLAPREVKTGKFKAAGGMAATGMLEKLLKVPFQYATSWTKKAILAAGYTNETVGKLLANSVEGPAETAAFANLLIASEPMVRKLKDTFGDDAAYSIIKDAKASIDRSVVQDSTIPQGDSQKSELIRFLQSQKGKVKLGVKP